MNDINYAALFVLLLVYFTPMSLIFMIHDECQSYPGGAQAFELKLSFRPIPPRLMATSIRQAHFDRLKETKLHLSSGRVKYNQQLGEFERLGIIPVTRTETDFNSKNLNPIDENESKSINFEREITFTCEADSEAGPEVGATEARESFSEKYQNRFVKLYDFSSWDPIKFQPMWEIQKDIVEGHVQRLKVEFQKEQPKSQFLHLDEFPMESKLQQNLGRQKERPSITSFDKSRGCDAIIILQHQPVYTLGTASDASFIKSIGEDIDVVRIERGMFVKVLRLSCFRYFRYFRYFRLSILL